MNVKRYEFELEWCSPHIAYVLTREDKEGQYVHIDDYMHLMGVIRKLRTKIEKKNRRSRKFREAGVSR